MITFDVYVSGTKIGSKLTHEPEEFADCLMVLANSKAGLRDTKLAEHVSDTGAAEKVVEYLRKLADMIEEVAR